MYSVVNPTIFDIHYLNKNAKIVIMGISPGRTQTKVKAKDTEIDLMTLPKEERNKICAFAGKLRENLIDMLNKICIHKLLGIDNCESLWGNDFELVNHTSILPYSTIKCRREKWLDSPSDIDKVLKENKTTNYKSGGYISSITYSAILKSDLLREEVFSLTLQDLKFFSKAGTPIIALGHSVYKILSEINNKEKLGLIIIPFVHPSMQNKSSGLIDIFLGEKMPNGGTASINAKEFGLIAKQMVKELMGKLC